jgi:hypothetical protein
VGIVTANIKLHSIGGNMGIDSEGLTNEELGLPSNESSTSKEVLHPGAIVFESGANGLRPVKIIEQKSNGDYTVKYLGGQQVDLNRSDVMTIEQLEAQSVTTNQEAVAVHEKQLQRQSPGKDETEKILETLKNSKSNPELVGLKKDQLVFNQLRRTGGQVMGLKSQTFHYFIDAGNNDIRAVVSHVDRNPGFDDSIRIEEYELTDLVTLGELKKQFTQIAN